MASSSSSSTWQRFKPNLTTFSSFNSSNSKSKTNGNDSSTSSGGSGGSKKGKSKPDKPRSGSSTPGHQSPGSRFSNAMKASSFLSIPQAVQLSMLASGVISIKDEHSKLLTAMENKPVDKETFLKLCDERRKFPILYKVEFQLGCKSTTASTADLTHTVRHATKLKNKDKNQNMHVIPYDYNRVVLEPSDEFPSDYINASYVDSLLEPNAYVVCQGPTEATVDDFWRMIWQKRISNIIMLTKTFDFIKVMCVQYWPSPPKSVIEHGGLEIRVVKENKLANFYIRTLRIQPTSDKSGSTARDIIQFHYVEWPCHSGPFPTALLDFRRRIRQIYSQNPEIGKGQTLVHCSDGGGRSGVYLEIDANLELLDEDGLIDVFGYLKKLRGARRGLVEDVDQIKFIYDTLEEYVICRKTWFPVAELSQRLKHKSMKEPLTKINEYQKEFLLICKQTPRFTIGDCAGGHRADNREKNRDVLVIPPDNFRPYLTSFQGNTFTDYINAVFVDSYTQSRGYIVTEWPLLETCSYLWSLVYDYDASAVVILSNPESSTSYPPFWPTTNRSKKYGPVFTIDPISQNHYPNIKSWAFQINKKIVSLTELMAGVKAEPKMCKFFQLTCWPMEHKVPTSTNSLVELMNMVERWKVKCGSTGPVVVISPDGRSRAGVYCAANACIEQVIQYGEVDVFTAVKTVRRHRPQLIDNMTEYKYCYDVVLHYVLHYLNKEHQQQSASGSKTGSLSQGTSTGTLTAMNSIYPATPATATAQVAGLPNSQ